MLRILAAIAAVAVLGAAEMLANPAFASGTTGWNLPERVAGLADGKPMGAAAKVLRIAATTPGWHMANQWSLPLPAGAATLQLSATVQTTGIVPGSATWDRPRLMALFLRADSSQLSEVGAIEITTDAGWRRIEGTVPVPAGAASVAFCVGLHNCHGTIEIAGASCQARP